MLLFAILLLTILFSGCESSNIPQTETNLPTELTKKQIEQPWHSADIDTLEKVIYDVAFALKIPYGKNINKFSPNIYPNIIRYEDKSTNNPRQVYLRFMLNKEIVDLTYANIILKQEVEKNKGKLVTCKTFAKWKDYLVGQKLIIRNHDNSIEYIVRLVYDKSPYTDAEQSQEIALVLTEIGNDKNLVLDNLDLIKSNNISLAFYGDGSFSNSLNKTAIENNIETLLTIPLEAYPSRHSFDQLNAIKVQNPINSTYIFDSIRSLHQNIGSVKGLTHYWGDFATSEVDFMEEIISYCAKYNLFYIDAMTTSKSKGFKLALHNQIMSSWALSYNQVTPKNLTSYLKKNSNPVLIMPFKTNEDVKNLKKIISLIDKKHFRKVYVSDLLNTDLPIIE